MSINKINFWDGITPSEPNWSSLFATNDNVISLSADWSVRYAGARPSAAPSSVSGATSEAAVWVDSAPAADRGHFSASWIAVTILGPANTSFDFEVFASSPNGRSNELRLNGGTPVIFDSSVNRTQTVILSGATDATGTATFEFKNAEGSSAAYVAAARIIPGATAADPSLTITNADAITPGTTLTAVASDFAAAPTTISLSDGASPALTPALTATASGDDYDLSALIADFKAQADAAGEGVAVQGLRIGTITATVE